MKHRNEVILLVCFLFGLSSCVSQPFTSTPTQVPTLLDPTPTHTPTPNFTATKFPNSKMCETEKYQGNYGTSIRREFGESPDKTWLFVQCHLNDDELPSHYVLYNQSDPNKTLALEYSEILDFPYKWYSWGWTKDSEYVYLGYHEFCEHPGICGYIDVKGLFRLNPATQEFIPVLPFREDQKQYAIALSNDAKVLAFIILDTHVLHLQGLSKDVNSEIALPSNQRSYGDIVWSPDDQKLLFASSSYEDVYDYSLWLFDSNDSSITQLLAEVDKEFYIRGWIDNSTILLYQFDAGLNQPFRHTYNLQTGQLLLVEATPSSTP